MPTTKKRIQVPVSDRVFKELEKLAEKRGISLSSLSYQLLEEALELQEDIYFSKTGDESLEKTNIKSLVNHEKAWS